MRSSLKFRATAAVVLLGLMSSLTLQAQEKPAVQSAAAKKRPDSEPAKPRPATAENDAVKRILDEMSEEERQRFRSAVNQVWHSEDVEQRRQEMQNANLAYRRSLIHAVRNLDVSEKIRSVLLRLIQLRFKNEIKAADGVGGNPPQRPGVNGANRPYSAEDRAIINAARIAAEKTPAVIAAKRNLDKAVTTRQRSVASGQYREAMRKAMEIADPRVKRLFSRRAQAPPRANPTDRRRPPARN